MNPRKFDALARLSMAGGDNLIAGEEMEEEGARFDRIRSAGPAPVFSAPLLFQTPTDLAARMVGMLEVEAGQSILEPSAGTGRLLEAFRRAHGVAGFDVQAVELDRPLLGHLYDTQPGVRLSGGDFLDFEPLRAPDRILMNPPWKRGMDIRHIRHAIGMMAPGGLLVGLVYDGPKQRKVFGTSEIYEPLSPGTFRQEGTTAPAALIVVRNESVNR